MRFTLYLDGRLRRIGGGLLLLAAAAAGQTVSFAPPEPFPGGQFPTSAVFGDFNKDGNLDVAILDQNASGFFILLGRGDGTFQPGATLPLQNLPYSLAVGDANNDGNLDLFVVSAAAGSLSVLLGRGDGTFQAALNSPTAQSSPRGIAVGDFNADGRLDLAISTAVQANGGAQVGIALGKGDGTFSTGGSYPAGVSPGAIQVADLNGDGRPDLVVQDQASNNVYVLLGTGGGQFNPLPPLAAGNSQSPDTGSLALVDLNGDKHLDLISGKTGTLGLSIALGKGDGTFSPAGSVTKDLEGSSFAVGDFNGDGKPDIAVAYLSNVTVSVFAGKGDGTFQPAQEFVGGSLSSFVLAADLNRDGLTDLITMNPYANGVTVLRNTTGSALAGSPVLSLSSSQLQFTLTNGGPPPPPQVVSITNSGGGTLSWIATSDVPWLSILNTATPGPPPSPSQASGTAPSILTVFATPIGLSPGAYTGHIVVTGAGATNSPQTIPVTLTLPGPTSTAPPPYLYSIQNSASYANKVAQGSIFVVTGANLGPAQLAQASASSLPAQLAGTSVQVVIGGAIVACPIAYASASQIAAVLPSSTPLGRGTFTVSFNGQTSYPGQIQVVSSGVGIYSVASSGIGSGIITGLDYVIKTMAQPAKPGDIVIAWATGLGPVNGNDAIVSPSPLFSNVEILVGDLPAQVIAAGRSGCCAGLDQIAFQVPPAPLGCFVPVSIRVAGGAVGAGGSTSNFVTLPLSQSGGPCSNPAPGLPPALVSKASSGQPLSVGLLAIGPGNVLHGVAPSLQATSIGSPRVLAGQLSKALRVTVPEADVVRLLSAYQSGDAAAVRKILARYARALKNNPSARRLLRAAADLSQQQAAVAAFGMGTGLGLVGPEYASEFPPVGTCTIAQNFPADPAARTSGLDAGSALTVNGPAGRKTMPQVSDGQYSVVLGIGSSSTTYTTPGFYTISGTGGSGTGVQNIGPFSVSLNVANPVTWTNKSAVNIVDRTQPLTLNWSGGAASGHVLIGGNVRVSDAGAFFLCAEDAQKGTFTIPQFVLSALSASQNTTLFIAPHPLDNPVSIPGLDLAFLSDGSSDSRTVTVQ